jgi:hypothetical protein
MKFKICSISGSENVDAGLLGYYTMKLYKWLSVFQRIQLLPSSTLKMEAVEE